MLIIASILTANALESHYNHYATWETIPEIVVCGQNSPSIEMVNDALQYWKKIGYEFQSNIREQKNCPQEKVGKIIIKNEHLIGEQGSTVTKKYTYSDSLNKEYVDYAIISVDNYQEMYSGENKDSLTHEIGHAVGISHVNNTQDVMYPYLIK